MASPIPSQLEWCCIPQCTVILVVDEKRCKDEPWKMIHIQLSRRWSWGRRGVGGICGMYSVWNLNQRHQRWRDACTWVMGVRSHQWLHLFVPMNSSLVQVLICGIDSKNDRIGFKNEQWYHVKNAIRRWPCQNKRIGQMGICRNSVNHEL